MKNCAVLDPQTKTYTLTYITSATLEKNNIMSDSTVITPGAGQSVITSSNENDHRDHWEQNANFRALFESVTNNAKDSAAGFKDALATAYLVEGRLNTQAALNAAAIQVQAEKLAAAATLAEAVHTADIKAQMAECCCKLSSLVIEKNQEVVNRVNEIEISRQAVLLSDEKQKVIALQAQIIAMGGSPTARCA